TAAARLASALFGSATEEGAGNRKKQAARTGKPASGATNNARRMLCSPQIQGGNDNVPISLIDEPGSLLVFSSVCCYGPGFWMPVDFAAAAKKAPSGAESGFSSVRK